MFKMLFFYDPHLHFIIFVVDIIEFISDKILAVRLHTWRDIGLPIENIKSTTNGLSAL